MRLDEIGFKLNEIALEKSNYVPVPDGKYPVVLGSCVLKDSQGGNKYFALEYIVADGEFKNRKLFDQLMVSGSEKAVHIGKQKLKALAQAVGKEDAVDTEEFIGYPLLAVVGIKEDKNYIKYVKAFNSATHRIDTPKEEVLTPKTDAQSDDIVW